MYSLQHRADRDILRTYRLRDISVGGAQFEGQAPAAVGDKVLIRISNTLLQGTITRAVDGRFGARFDTSLASRIAAVRHVYSGVYQKAIQRVAPAAVASAMFQRLMK